MIYPPQRAVMRAPIRPAGAPIRNGSSSTPVQPPSGVVTLGGLPVTLGGLPVTLE